MKVIVKQIYEGNLVKMVYERRGVDKLFITGKERLVVREDLPKISNVKSKTKEES